MVHHFPAPWVVDIDTVRIAAQPVIAVTVFRHCIDVTKSKTLDTGQTFLELIDPILIGSYPYLIA